MRQAVKSWQVFLKDKLMRADKTKIVHILEGFTGGLSTYMCNVLPELVKNGFEITLV